MARRNGSVQHAKNRFSEVVEAARRASQTVTKHGKSAVVVVEVTEYERLRLLDRVQAPSLAELLLTMPQDGDELLWQARRLLRDIDHANSIVLAMKLTYAMADANNYFMSERSERHVKLFKNGRNQAVRIPREFELPGEDAIIRKDGERLVIEPAPPRSLLAVLATLPTLDEEFGSIEDFPAEPVDL